MKKITIISLCVAICILFAACKSKIELPPVDNTTPAEKLITTTYSDADLAAIGEKYEGLSIYELAEDFKIECLRDPGQFCGDYFPYVVLMSNTGKRAFVFFADGAYQRSREVEKVYMNIVTDGFKSREDMENILEGMLNNGATWEEVYALYPYYTGVSTVSARTTQSVAVKEGVFVTQVYNGSVPTFSELLYYSDEELFSGKNIEHEHGLARTIRPLLTIDKNL